MIDYDELEELFHQSQWDEASQVKVRVIIEKLIAEIDRLLAENAALQVENEELQFDRIVLGDRLEAAL